jgi:hypothetical protein
MIWAPIAAFGMAAWFSAAVVILGLCRAARRADKRGSVRPASDQRSVFVSGKSNVVDLCAFRAARTRPVVCVAAVAEQACDRGSYLSSRDSRRSFSSLPSVWQVGQ